MGCDISQPTQRGASYFHSLCFYLQSFRDPGSGRPDISYRKDFLFMACTVDSHGSPSAAVSEKAPLLEPADNETQAVSQDRQTVKCFA